MRKKATLVWCIGLLDGVYCIICSAIPYVQNYMGIGPISLPSYFAAALSSRSCRVIPAAQQAV